MIFALGWVFGGGGVGGALVQVQSQTKDQIAQPNHRKEGLFSAVSY